MIDKEDHPDIVKVALSSESYIYLSKAVHVYFEAMRGILYHKKIHKLLETNKDAYLVQLSNVNYDMAVVSWCKLFGTKRLQHTHFMRLMTLEEEDFKVRKWISKEVVIARTGQLSAIGLPLADLCRSCSSISIYLSVVAEEL